VDTEATTTQRVRGLFRILGAISYSHQTMKKTILLELEQTDVKANTATTPVVCWEQCKLTNTNQK